MSPPAHLLRLLKPQFNSKARPGFQRKITKMAWRSSGSTNGELVGKLWENGLISDERVRGGMLNVDRAHFCPDSQSAYQDSPQLIGYNATISAPHMHASATESLLPYIHVGSRVLDIGSGSGYLTAVFGELVFPPWDEGGGDDVGGGKGVVVGLEHIEQLREMGERNYRKSERGKQLLDEGKVRFVKGDGRKGLVLDENGGEGGWDAIHVGAAAVELHQELIDQLRRPGRIFIPVQEANGEDQYIWVITKDKDGNVERKREYGVRYVPLTDAPS